MKLLERGITIEIKFSHKLIEEDQNTFWKEFIIFIEKEGLTFGGGHNEDSFEGYIDLSETSKVERFDFFKRLDRFVLSKRDLIGDYKVKKKKYLKRVLVINK